MRISCIMPSFLGDYPGAAPNRKQIFVRAVNSFLAQTHKDCELICISDGCPETIQIVKSRYKKELEAKRIVLLELPRHPLFTGSVRQSGIDAASGEVVCNLDGDDYFLPHHLTSINSGFTADVDWVYWNYWIRPDNIKGVDHLFESDGTLERMNNWSHAWRRSLPVSWEGCDGKGVDNKIFLARLLEFPKRKKIYGTGYCVTNVQIL